MKTERNADFSKLVATNFFFWLGVYVYVPVLPVFLQTHGFTNQEIGAIVGSFSLGSILFRLAAGKAADHWGTVRIALSGLCAATAAVLAYLCYSSSLVLLVARFCHGIGSALYSAAAITMVTFLRSEGEVKSGVALHTLCSMIGIGLAMCLALSLFEQGGFVGVVIVSAATGLLGLALLPKSLLQAKKAASPSLPLKKVVTDAAIYLPTLIQFAVYVCYSGVMTYLPLLLKEAAPELSLQSFYVSYACVVVASRFGAGRINSTTAERSIARWMLSVLAAVSLLPFFTLHWSALCLLGGGLGLAVGLATPLLAGMIAVAITPASRGAALGFFATAIDGGMFCGALLCGALAESAGYRIVFPLLAMAMLVVLLLCLRQEQKAKERPACSNC